MNIVSSDSLTPGIRPPSDAMFAVNFSRSDISMLTPLISAMPSLSASTSTRAFLTASITGPRAAAIAANAPTAIPALSAPWNPENSCAVFLISVVTAAAPAFSALNMFFPATDPSSSILVPTSFIPVASLGRSVV